MITANDIIEFINERTPDLYSPDMMRAAWVQQAVVAVLKEAREYYSSMLEKVIGDCVSGGIVSDTYIICSPVRRSFVVDVEKAEQNLPEEKFLGVAHIHPSDAAKLVGPDTLFDWVLDEVGYEQMRPFVRINKDDLAKIVPASAMPEYLKENIALSAERRVCLRPDFAEGEA